MSSDVVLRGDRQSDVLISAYLVSMLVFSKPPQLSANVWYNGTWTVELKSCSVRGNVSDDDAIMRKMIAKIISMSM